MLGKDESEIDAYEIDVQKPLDDFPPMISSTQTALFFVNFIKKLIFQEKLHQLF